MDILIDGDNKTKDDMKAEYVKKKGKQKGNKMAQAHAEMIL